MTGRVLVTGGLGFIGSHAVERFLQAGHAVRVLDNESTGSASNVKSVASAIDVRLADLRDPVAVTEAVSDVDLVVHLGALGSVPRSVADPMTTHEVNASGTLNLLIAARDAGVKRLVFASSSSVFGSNRQLPKVEDMIGEPLSPYAATKKIGEDYCRQFGSLFGFDTVIVRFFNVFGPRQAADHAYAAVIPRFIDAALAGRSVEVHGDGLQSRDFTFVENAVDGLVAVSDLANSHVSNETFHVARGESVSLLSILDDLEEILGTDVARRHVESRPGDIRSSLADISKLVAATRYSSTVSIRQGLEQTVQWFRGRSEV